MPPHLNHAVEGLEDDDDIGEEERAALYVLDLSVSKLDPVAQVSQYRQGVIEMFTFLENWRATHPSDSDGDNPSDTVVK